MLHERSNKTASFGEHLKFQEYMTFIHTPWVNSGKSKSKNQNQDNIHFGNALYRVLHDFSSLYLLCKYAFRKNLHNYFYKLLLCLEPGYQLRKNRKRKDYSDSWMVDWFSISVKDGKIIDFRVISCKKGFKS